jgi:hypothetical protein
MTAFKVLSQNAKIESTGWLAAGKRFQIGILCDLTTQGTARTQQPAAF